MNGISKCVACYCPRWSVAEVRNGYELAVCSECGLLFTTNPDYRPERYLAAYGGAGEEGILPEELSHVYTGPQLRLELEGRAYFRPPPRLTRAERLALHWLKKQAPPGAVTVECGCGTGRFLHALKRSKLQATGVELSSNTIEALKRAGLQAIQGAAPDFQWSGPEPFAIAFFEVLEHVPEPRMLLEPLKRRFPRATILASVPSPKSWPPRDKGPADSPPHHYLLWTSKALEKCFCGLGYTKVAVESPKPVGYEQMPTCGAFLSRFKRYRSALAIEPGAAASQNLASAADPRTARLAATAKVWLLAAYHLTVNILGAPKAIRAGQQGFSASSMFVVAEP